MRTALKAFLNGVASFVSVPGGDSDVFEKFRASKRGPPDISRYFGIVGMRLSDAYAKFGEEHGIEKVKK